MTETTDHRWELTPSASYFERWAQFGALLSLLGRLMDRGELRSVVIEIEE